MEQGYATCSHIRAGRKVSADRSGENGCVARMGEGRSEGVLPGTGIHPTLLPWTWRLGHNKNPALEFGGEEVPDPQTHN